MLHATLSFAFFLLLAAGLQIAGNAYRADLSGFDETAHYVTGLMLRSYALSGDWFEPMKYAQTYYASYPRVALGHWPPVFYLIEALWTILFSPARTSVMLLMACLSAAGATALYWWCRREIGTAAAFAAAALVVTFPTVQEATASVMLELPLLLGSLLALLFYTRYLETERLRYSLLFGAAATAAILTKANGFALALVPLAVLFAGKLYLVRRLSFWAPAAPILCFCLPWYYLTLPLVHRGYPGAKSPSGHYLTSVLLTNLNSLYLELGFVALAAALSGVVLTVVLPLVRRKPVSPIWSVSIAALAGGIAFHSFAVPLREARHLIPSLALLAMFAVTGAQWLAERWTRPPHRQLVVLTILGLLCCGYGLERFRLQWKPSYGASTLAGLLTSEPYRSENVLVASPDALGEGAVIAEVAMREPTPQRRILRASKLFAQVSWDGRHYKPLIGGQSEALQSLRKSDAGLLVIARIHGSKTEIPYYPRLLRLPNDYPRSFEPIDFHSVHNIFELYKIDSSN